MKKKAVPVLLAVLILIVILGLIAVVSRVVERYIPSNEWMDSSEYFGIQQEGQMALILQDQLLEQKGLLADGVPYLNMDVVSEYLNDRFYWDSGQELVIYTTPDSVIKAYAGAQEYMVADSTQTADYVPVRVQDGTAYIAAEFVKQYTAMDYEVFQDPDRIVITYRYGEVTRADAKRTTQVRELGGIKSPILTEVSGGEQVTVLMQMDDWSEVVTADGYIGYVQNSSLGETYTETLTTDFVEPVYTSIHRDYKINMVWHQVTSQEANDNLFQDIAEMEGVNVISPTWFSITDNDGNISSLADSAYVEAAHGQGLEVWGLVDNFSTEIDTAAVLNNTASRERLAEQLVNAALEYNLEGINVDFELIPEDAADGYIQFLREISIRCRANSLVLSVDNPVPMEFNAHYNLNAQGEVVDYVIIMGYDEHYVGSEPGSVASISFVTDGVTKALEEGVPAEKTILAVPFYTRLWQTDTSGNVTSEAYGMDAAQAVVNDNGAVASWNEETAQDYAEFTGADGSFFQIWLENEASLEEKLKLVQQYELGGAAAWKLGFERASVWAIMEEYTS